SPDEIHFDAADSLKVTGSLYTSMKLFVNSIPDFQILTMNEQRSLFQRNLHGVSAFCGNILLRDTALLDNPKCFDAYVTVYGLEMMKQLKYFINQLDSDSTSVKLMLLVITFCSNNY